MSEENPAPREEQDIPEAEVRTKRGFSLIWVVPVVALIIGGGLAYKAWSEKGPVISIAFDTAEGLVADKTMIRFKDVEIGKVTAIELKEDLSGVILTAEMDREAARYMTDQTRFWVVRARVAAGEVSGLGTLLSGAYIGCSPSLDGRKQHHFTGLEKPPVLTEGEPGRHFLLEAKSLGSLDLGSPVYYRGIKVGQVVDYEFDATAEQVMIRVFVQAPFHEKVVSNTRFWNASGIDLTLDASGVKLDTQSLVSIMLGGVGFGLRPHDVPGDPAEEDMIFKLFRDRETSRKEDFSLKRYYLMFFDQSVRGLSPGAPLEIKGIQVGEVIKVELLFDQKRLDFRIPVLVVLEPERIQALVTKGGQLVRGAARSAELQENEEDVQAQHEQTRKLIEKGLRAQLKIGNLLTGQLFVDLDFLPGAPPADLRSEYGYPVFPTVPAPFEQIAQRADKILKNLEKVRFDRIGGELQDTLAELGEVLRGIDELSVTVNRETLPRINGALEDLQSTLEGIDTTLGPDSALNYDSRKLAEELTSVVRSLRSLLEYLERDPQAIIFGKDGEIP